MLLDLDVRKVVVLLRRTGVSSLLALHRLTLRQVYLFNHCKRETVSHEEESPHCKSISLLHSTDYATIFILKHTRLYLMFYSLSSPLVVVFSVYNIQHHH